VRKQAAKCGKKLFGNAGPEIVKPEKPVKNW